MNYHIAKTILDKSVEIGYMAIDEAIKDMPEDEFLQIPIIDEQTKAVALKHGVSMSIMRNKDYSRYWLVYIVGYYVARAASPTELKNNN